MNLVDDFLFQKLPLEIVVTSPQVWVLVFLAVLFSASRILREAWVQLLHVATLLFLSGPMTLASPFSFFGMWFFILGIILLYKYGFLDRWPIPKVLLAALYFVPFLTLSVLNNEGLTSSFIRVVGYTLFLVTCLLVLYFIFEEQIRDLLAANRNKDSALEKKDSLLAVQAAEIARLEPLTVLGERVAHVAHSFKNNLSLIGTVVFFLEQLHDEKRAVEKLKEFSKLVNDRIENILMISRAGVDLAPEEFDVARLLEGIKQVYLNDRSFADHAQTELTIEGPWLVTAVRWDFILMMENLLKNALEAILEKQIHGTIRIDLAAGRLTLANNGGSMVPCDDCRDSCLNCQRYGRPGRTTKRDGTGHGLSQVFGICRKNGWNLKINGTEPWTIIEISFS